MFVLRSIINHELYTDDVQIDGEFMHGVAGWEKWEDAEEQLNSVIKEKIGKYHVDDWEIVEVEDHKYQSINHRLENDSDLKAFYYNSGAYEILNSISGKLTRYEE